MSSPPTSDILGTSPRWVIGHGFCCFLFLTTSQSVNQCKSSSLIPSLSLGEVPELRILEQSFTLDAKSFAFSSCLTTCWKGIARVQSGIRKFSLSFPRVFRLTFTRVPLAFLTKLSYPGHGDPHHALALLCSSSQQTLKTTTELHCLLLAWRGGLCGFRNDLDNLMDQQIGPHWHRQGPCNDGKAHAYRYFLARKGHFTTMIWLIPIVHVMVCWAIITYL